MHSFLNPNTRRAASHYQRMNMKTLPLCVCSIVLAVTAFAQSPSAPADASPTATATASASISPGSLADKIHQKIDKKFKGHHGIVIDGDEKDIGDIKSDDIPDIAVPIVAIVFMAIFGAPVLIVALIMYFGFSRNRAMHRTIRMLAEKGQPIPATLLAPPAPAIRARSDLRRGIVLVMVGVGLMVCFGAWNDWEGGAWAIGVIPFVIGLGYLLVWKLEGEKKNEIPPPPPTP
jgi:Domain of unknown function (DUF6249)